MRTSVVIAVALDARGVPASRVGFCFDTAHAWGAGLDVRDATALDAFLAAFEARIGIDRLVMVLQGESSIREVIPFPKTQTGADPMTGAPTWVDEAQLDELGIALTRTALARRDSGEEDGRPDDG